MTIEQYVGEIILQDPIEVEVAGKKFKAAQPTAATLIEVSKYIGALPEIEIDKDRDIAIEALRVARHCEFLGDVVAILYVGKKRA